MDDCERAYRLIEMRAAAGWSIQTLLLRHRVGGIKFLPSMVMKVENVLYIRMWALFFREGTSTCPAPTWNESVDVRSSP